MDGPDWLRTQLTSFTCPACGRRYRGSKIRLLAERDGLFFVDLDCARCGSHTVAIVTVEVDDTNFSITDVSDVSLSVDALADFIDEGMPVGTEPVTADDVLEMHLHLAAFSGDVSQLLAPPAPPAPRSDGS